MARVFAPPRPDRAQGILETLLIVDGRPVALDAHLARLGESLATLFADRPAPDLAAAIRASALEIGRGGLRVTVAPDAETGLQATIVPAEIDLDLALPGEPPLVTAHSLVISSGLGRHKWADRSVLDQAQSSLPADAVALIVDWNGTVLESARGNVFAVVDEELITHPADGRILPGIARARTIEIASALGLVVREAALSRTELIGADEVFMTGSLRGLERVRELDGATLSASGEIGARLAAELRRAWT